MYVSQMIEWLKTLDPEMEVEVIETEWLGDGEPTIVEKKGFIDVERQTKIEKDSFNRSKNVLVIGVNG